MLNRIEQNSTSEILAKSSAIQRLSDSYQSNPIDDRKNFLIDESNISTNAIQKWERELDVKKFTHLVTSDPDDKSAEELVTRQIFEGKISFDDEELQGLFSNKKFLEDVMM